MLRGMFFRVQVVALSAATLMFTAPAPAEACGCFHPPEPVAAESYAVSQEAEQIIFEVNGDGTITAHVLIQYAGDPASFAWIVPVPSVPELDLSPEYVFALLDGLTGPETPPETENLCPPPAFACAYHPSPSCPGPDRCPGRGWAQDAAPSFSDASAPPPSAGPPVNVIDRQVIGAYETITFSAGDMAAAVAWLRAEGFIVTDAMAPFLQPYADAGMLFVASRLVPGAGVDAIRPLRMTYISDQPMIPLRPTAIAADPHLTVTAYIFGESRYEIVGHPSLTFRAEDLVWGTDRSNYPAALARQIDEAGGDAFLTEFAGPPPAQGYDSACCAGFDRCGAGGDGICQCPLDDFDAVDCGDEIVTGALFLEEMRSRHTWLTRLTTRISPEEMTFDPLFAPSTDGTDVPRIRASGRSSTLRGCLGSVVAESQDTVREIHAMQGCANLYCGAGECVVTSVGAAACACDAGYVARDFTDLDGARSVTCVPDTPPVDFAAGGLVLPDACAGVNCDVGTCVDVGGFPTCRCDAGSAAMPFGAAPTCAPIVRSTGTPGGQDYSSPLATIDVCAPAPPTCASGGWLVEQPRRDHVLLCDSSVPDPSRLVAPPAPECPPPPPAPDCGILDGGPGGGVGGGCACSATPRSRVPSSVFLLALALGLVGRRRRAR